MKTEGITVSELAFFFRELASAIEGQSLHGRPLEDRDRKAYAHDARELAELLDKRVIRIRAHEQETA